MIQAKIVGRGKGCPKCKRKMVRKSHPEDWSPRSSQPYYFAYWDVCGKCRHVQHYEDAKRYVGESTAQNRPNESMRQRIAGKPIVGPNYVPTPEPYPGCAPWEE